MDRKGDEDTEDKACAIDVPIEICLRAAISDRTPAILILGFPNAKGKKRYLATVDAAGNTIFKTKHYWLGGFTQLRDAAGYTVLTMKPKFITWHDRWQAFRGDSMEAKDLVFSIMRSCFLQFYDEWFVYLGGNTEEKTYDFRKRFSSVWMIAQIGEGGRRFDGKGDELWRSTEWRRGAAQTRGKEMSFARKQPTSCGMRWGFDGGKGNGILESKIGFKCDTASQNHLDRA
ncbi:Protein LURP-one-related 15 [Dendrobium catenatum]|uniref:Protein LURP-one-related 15 n=1 Tax=Dendrobium catenatum TaxID=906689 RepID=A0A2I0WKB1_9ASPA|nr:Protein LURP-one-related 15 [Dendrobium catenatum]